ncbi:MAG: GGDEF domain-containing protein [Candidatus Margulisiibacteriota bacterium]
MRLGQLLRIGRTPAKHPSRPAPSKVPTLASRLWNLDLRAAIPRAQVLGTEVNEKLYGLSFAALSGKVRRKSNDIAEALRSAALLALDTEGRIKALNAKIAELEKMTTIDGLTGLYVKDSFNKQLTKEITRNRRSPEEKLSVIMLDIDHFKKINDTHGHPVGDEVLVQIAEVMKECVHRAGDYVARWGGEEFAIILPETGKEGARAVAERLRGAVEGHKFETEKGTLRVTISVGVAGLEKTQKMGELIEFADRALYKAKHNGRNQVVVAEEKIAA